jgi:glycosyltransferase involved in cell wall biosynthesis
LSASALRVLVWQWGRRGAGPRFAVELAAGLAAQSSVVSLLSLSTRSEQMQAADKPDCALPYRTYSGLAGYVGRVLSAPFLLPPLRAALRRLAPDVAICAMPAPLDLLMATALGLLGVPFYVVVHDADAHPGDGFPMQMTLQRLLVRRAHGLITLSGHITRRLQDRGEVRGRDVVQLHHPPFAFGQSPLPPRAHGGKLRLLFFGRLLPYKGLGLFANTLRLLDRTDIAVRVIGQGPDTEALAALRGMDGVSVENRWVPEAEIGELLAWADAVVLTHTEASQSGVAAAAVAARRFVVATRVGGLVEQLQDEPLARMAAPEASSLADAIRSLIDDPPVADVAGTAPDRGPGAWRDMAAALVAKLRAALRR